MKRAYAVLAILGFLNLTNINAAEFSNLRSETCSKETSGPYVHSDDFNWGMTLEEIRSKGKEIYNSGKRLKNRAFFNGQQVVMPISIFGGVDEVKLTPLFLKSIQKHLEVALGRGYIDAVIFPDLGHSHMFIPMEYYQNVLSPIPVKEKARMYELMLAHPDLKILYHTAEQLTMVDEAKLPLVDREVQWRFYTRNLVGDNQGLGRMELLHEASSSHNTSHTYDGKHKYWGAGFNISESKDGCFSFKHKGETKYFDLSFEDLTPSVQNDYDWGM
ncbi:MAG: hypothetical protein ACJAT2_003040 [Bacteriovoracaceae bacterium]|jgi:hypothetical protein